MIHLAEWFSSELLRPLGLALLHFLWQGAALGALAALAMSLAKRASARYLIGVAVMFAMAASPIATFTFLQRQTLSVDSAAPTAIVDSQQISVTQIAHRTSVQRQLDSQTALSQQNSYSLLVEAWFLGVLLFSVRTAGGVLVLERLRRREAVVVCDKLLQRCISVQRRMGLHRVIRYCESLQLDVPAVIGWLRPVVLLPFSALSGLSEMQLEAVIAHELAHVRRYDAFVNLFQVAVESVLFYHPAVWWLSKRVRIEREHCCDDAAITICGSPFEYARALTLMEEWRSTPSLAMALNRGPLVVRVRRLLGAPTINSGMRTAGLAACLLCISVAAAAGNAMFGIARSNAAVPQSPARDKLQREKDVASAFVIRAESPADPQQPAKPATPAPTATPHPAPSPEAQRPTPAPMPMPELATEHAQMVTQQNSVTVAVPVPVAVTVHLPEFAFHLLTVVQASAQTTAKTNSQIQVHESYIDGMKAAGLNNLSVDDLISMKIQGITPEYVRSMQAEGLKIDPDDLIGMKVQGITPEYIHQLREQGLKLDADELIGMKVQGITPAYIQQMKALGLSTDADDLIGMKVQGITPEYVSEIRATGMKVDSDSLIGMKVQGITPAYVKEIQALGLHVDPDDIIGMKVQGITPEYVKALQASGFKFDVDELIGAKVQGVTPQFIDSARSHGFKDLTLQKLIELKVSGVLE
jgi:beta-lactamase regulating signal transducer with metallopeptidase domain/predicted HAD superfamily phosphohydrolase YqeG